MNCRTLHVIVAAALTSLALPALAQSSNAVLGEKQDSGLGTLPHYSKWTVSWATQATQTVSTRVEGESLDNQLGELPHYRLWVDRTGKDPMGTAASFRYAGAKSAAKAPAAPAAVVVQSSN